MYIDLFDTKKKQDVRLDVTVEYTTPTPHLLLVLADPEQTEVDEKYGESRPFGAYTFKALHHLTGVKGKYEGRSFGLTLGFYLDAPGWVPVLLNQTGNGEANRFANAQLSGNQMYAIQILVNTQEHEWHTKLGLQQLSFPEYVSRLIEEQSTYRPFSRVFYDINLQASEFQCQNLVEEQQWDNYIWDDYIEEEEELLEEDEAD